MTKLVHVAVGVIVGSDGKILIAKRPESTHQGGLWEFPGGKVAPGETVQEALTRELHEELAIQVKTTEALIQIHHDYGDKSVLLDVYKVVSFSGIACGNEGQPILWVAPAELNQYPFPAANRAIISAVTLPSKMLITGAANSLAEYLQRTEKALQKGVSLVQLRCPQMPVNEYQSLARQMFTLCKNYDANLLLNTTLDIHSSLPFGCGLHLNSHQLNELSQKLIQERPVAENILLGASCHNAEEITQARLLGVDYITLSPVMRTNSHPDGDVLGWDEFGRLVACAGMPVFALGGMSEADISLARSRGAQGIAAISCWWK